MSPFTSETFDTVDAIAPSDWNQLVSEPCLPMDRRLIALQERVLSNQARLWTLLVRDPAGAPAAIACLARFDLDALHLPRALQSPLALARKPFPRLLKNRVLFVGLPLPCGSNHLRIHPALDPAPVLAAIENAVQKLARAQRAAYVVWKEFEPDDPLVSHLPAAGYVQGTLPAMHRMAVAYTDFPHYLDALKSRYRNQITRSQKRFAAAGFRALHLTDPADIERRMTPAVHELYRAVYEKSRTQLELLPLAFFQQVARALPGQVSLTLVEDPAARIVGWTLAIRYGDIHYNVYSGVDYALNDTGHIYFNLFYHDLDHAFRSGAKVVHLGETSDGFKSRLGTEPLPMHCFVRPRNPLVRLIVKRFAHRIFPQQRLERHDVFKEQPDTPSRPTAVDLSKGAG